MPRPLRIEVPGALFHIATRSAARRVILRDDEDRDALLGLMRRTCQRQGWLCRGYCLLSTHYHLLVTTPKPNLAPGMQWLNGLYASMFNERHAYNGHVFGGRYKSVLVQSDAHLVYLVAYLAMNPVKAGICRDPAEWSWSSYRALLGEVPAGFLRLGEVMRMFAFDPAEARRRIEAYVFPDDVEMVA
jgi:REP element-mobilizing transposase RayT